MVELSLEACRPRSENHLSNKIHNWNERFCHIAIVDFKQKPFIHEMDAVKALNIIWKNKVAIWYQTVMMSV